MHHSFHSFNVFIDSYKKIAEKIFLHIYVFSEWKATVTRYTVELQSSKLKGAREDVIKLLRSKASNVYTEVTITIPK